nr:hypothetical protein [uncultured Lachnoclostridium sp.]
MEALNYQNYHMQEIIGLIPFKSVVVMYPESFIEDPVLEDNIPKMLSIIREFIECVETYELYKSKILNARWDIQKKEYSNKACKYQVKMDKLAKKMNEGISPYIWRVFKGNDKIVHSEISHIVDYVVKLI